MIIAVLVQVDGQLALLAAAKHSGGVKLFIPSEFGLDTEVIAGKSGTPLLDVKYEILKAVKASGLEYTFIYTGHTVLCVFTC